MHEIVKAFLFPISNWPQPASEAREANDSKIPEEKPSSTITLLDHPKLQIIDSENGSCKKALTEMITIEVGREKLDNALNHKDLGSLIIKYEEKVLGSEAIEFGIFDGKKSFKIIVGDVLPNDFYCHIFTPDQAHKCIGDKFTNDQAIFHELAHVNQELKSYSRTLKQKQSCSKKLDFSNQLEEEAIEIENKYLKAKDLPLRSDHSGSKLLSAKALLNTSPDYTKKEFALKNYLYNGLYDAVEISETFKNDELIEILQSLKTYKPNIIEQVSPYIQLNSRSSSSYSEDFLEILFLIIKEKDLEINFSKPEWQSLLTVCLDNVHTLEDFKKLESMEINNQVFDFSFCSKINDRAKKYSKIVNYIISKQTSDMRKFFLNLRYKNYYANP